MLKMTQVLYVSVLAVGLCVCAVLSYPTDLEEDIYYNQPAFLELEPSNAIYPPDIPETYIYPSPYEQSYVSKRSRTALKRASWNKLLRRLLALYGSNEIPFTGQSSHTRFGVGGR